MLFFKICLNKSYSKGVQNGRGRGVGSSPFLENVQKKVFFFSTKTFHSKRVSIGEVLWLWLFVCLNFLISVVMDFFA